MSQPPLELPEFEDCRQNWDLVMLGFLVRRVIKGVKTETRRANRRWLKAKPGDWIYIKGTNVVCVITDYPYQERIASISWKSALAEGIIERDSHYYSAPGDLRQGYQRGHVSPIAAFFDLWARLHPEGSASCLNKNPKVVVIKFRYFPISETKS
jgi:hypothetical protein